jgi:hypothetical protein
MIIISVCNSARDYAANFGVRTYRYETIKQFEIDNNNRPWHSRYASNGEFVRVITRNENDEMVTSSYNVKRMKNKDYLKLYPIKGDAFNGIKSSQVSTL